MQEYLETLDEDMDSCIDAFKKDLNTVRTGRASPQILDGVQVAVAAYGATMPLNQLATITAPDARLLVVNAWDKSTLPDIERAISSAGLGLNPSSDGAVIRVPIPALTVERRREMVKQVKRLAEDAKVRVRRVRRDYNELLRELESEKEISEDEMHRSLDQVQKTTNDYVNRVDKLSEKKQADVMEV